MSFVKGLLVALGKIENTNGGLILLAPSPETKQLFHIKSTQLQRTITETTPIINPTIVEINHQPIVDSKLLTLI